MTKNGDDIVARLERIALMAEVSNHHTTDGSMRLMPAAGVADVIREAMDAIVDLRVDRHIAEEAQGPRNGELRVVNYVQGFGRKLRKTTSGETLGPLFSHRLEQYFDGAWRGIRVFQETGSGNMMEIKQ